MNIQNKVPIKMKFIQVVKVVFFLLLVSCNSIKEEQQEPRIVSREGKAYFVQDSVLISTRDGAKLSAIIVRNKVVKEPQPAILFHTIYTRKDDINKAISLSFIE